MDLLEVLAEYNVNVFKNFSLPTLSFLETDMLFATLIAFYCLVCVAAIKFDAVKKRQKQEKQEDDRKEKQEDDRKEKQEDDKGSVELLPGDPTPEQIPKRFFEIASRIVKNFV